MVSLYIFFISYLSSTAEKQITPFDCFKKMVHCVETDMNDKYIVHGPPLKVPVSMKSLGIWVFEALKKQDNSNLFVDAFTNRVVTNKQLLETSIKLAKSLECYGLKQNDVIGICSENSIMYFHPFLASLYLGVITTMMNPKYSESELLHMLSISQPKVLFCSTSSKRKISKVIQEMKNIPKLVLLDEGDENQEIDTMSTFISNYLPSSYNTNEFVPKVVDTNDQVAVVLYSSGTTGLPKGVMLTHTNLNAGFAISKHPDAISKKYNVAVLPFFHAYGILVIFSKIISTQTVIVFTKFHPGGYLATIQDYKIEYLHLVPTIGHFLAYNELVDKYNLSSVKKVICLGAPLSENVESLLRKRFNLETVRKAYGLTESSVSITYSPEANGQKGSCGKAKPLVSIKIVDINTGKILGPMQKGELYCRGLQVMKGYMNDIESTKAAIDKNGWLRTGDLAYYDHDGYFYIIDRLKELIKYKGFQVPPAELESVLLKHPQIKDAAVVGIPDERYGELPFAFVVKTGQVTEKEVQDFVASHLSPEKHLSGGVKFIKRIPVTETGKKIKYILRHQLNEAKSKL